jgi:RIO kinase 2
LAAAREFAFLSALHSHQFPVPKPIEICRHTVVMELIAGPTLCNVSQLKSPAILYDKLMEIIIKLASYGLIHADFNEFNIMLMEVFLCIFFSILVKIISGRKSNNHRFSTNGQH